jgi:hypothetical protein
MVLAEREGAFPGCLRLDAGRVGVNQTFNQRLGRLSKTCPTFRRRNPRRASQIDRGNIDPYRTAELCISDDISGTHNSIPAAGLYLDEVADQ